jgi:hypothetical protein
MSAASSAAASEPPPQATVASAADASALPVTVEMLLLRVIGADGRGLCYRHKKVPLGAGEDPDSLAAQLAGIPAASAEGHLLHSTSWRYQPAGGLMLTYVAYPDPNPWLAAVLLTDPTIVQSANPSRPSPPRVLVPHVAAHAVRHLAFLADTDPAVRAVVHADRPLAQALAGLPRSPAGQLPPSAGDRRPGRSGGR